jgi:hypothetical protein
MHEARPYGHLVLNGNPVEGDALARMTGVPVDEVSALLAELRQAGVLSMTSKGVVFSRRMTKDHARAQKGRKAANKRWSQASDGVEQSDEPNGLPNRNPTTQKPEARDQIDKLPAQCRTIGRELDAAPPPSTAEIPRLPDTWLGDLSKAAGIRGNPHPGLANPAVVIGWLQAGFDWRRDILAGIASKPKPDVRAWAYFDGQIRDFVAVRNGVAAATKPPEAAEDWPKRLKIYSEQGFWAEAWGPKPGERGCRAPSELLARAA